MSWGREEEGTRETPQSPIEQPLGLVFPAYPSYPQSRWRQPGIASVTTEEGKARAGAQCPIPFLGPNSFTGVFGEDCPDFPGLSEVPPLCLACSPVYILDSKSWKMDTVTCQLTSVSPAAGLLSGM